MSIAIPEFPPLLNGHKVACGGDIALKAKSGIRNGKLSAGDFLWNDDKLLLEFALVLEPEVGRNRCGEMAYIGMVAIGDALGALCPPEVSIHFQWPRGLLVNGADAGQTNLMVSEEEFEGVPNWMIFSCQVRLKPDNLEIEPGDDLSLTNLWDEGCGELSKTQLLESCSKHMLTWIHNWQEDGFKPIYDQWWGRRFESEPIAKVLVGNGCELSGMDENGNALIKQGSQIVILETLATIATMHNGELR